MKKKQTEFLKTLVETPSPTGFETDVAQIVRERLSDVADEIQTDTMGSVHAILKGKAELEDEIARAAVLAQTGQGVEIGQDYEYVSAYGSTYGSPSPYSDALLPGSLAFSAPASLTVMLAAHMDEVGLMVTYISDDGFLSVSSIGGVDAAILPGMRVDVHTKEGVLRGVVARKPIHLIEPDERKSITPLDKLAIDLGLSGDEVRKRVRVGDPITYGVGFERMGECMAVSKSFDDKCGVFVACRVMEALAEAGRAEATFISAITVQEEIGTRGAITSAHSLNPDVAVAFDVTHATDYPGIDKSKYGNIVCGAGPVIARGPNINPYVFERLVAAAEAEGIDYQLEAEPGVTGTDARSIQVAQGGIPTGLISIPLRYMHTPAEVIDLKDLEGAIRLITRFVSDLDVTSTFIPGISEEVEHPNEGNVNKAKKSDSKRISDLKRQIRDLNRRITELEGGKPEDSQDGGTVEAADSNPAAQQDASRTGSSDISNDSTEKMQSSAPKADFSSYQPSFSSIVSDGVKSANQNSQYNPMPSQMSQPGMGGQPQAANGVAADPVQREFKRNAFPAPSSIASAIPGSAAGMQDAPYNSAGYQDQGMQQAGTPGISEAGTFNILPIIGAANDERENQ